MPSPDAPLPAALTRPLLLIMAAATGCAVANLYYNQPMLGLIARDIGGGGNVGFVAMATQLGYAAGIVLLVPLGDRMDRRLLILMQCAGLTLAAIVAAIAPTLGALLAASVAIGIFATLAQQIIPFAAELAPPARRGQIVGTVMSGLLCGILLARTLSGAVGQAFGWREMFWLSAVLAVLVGIVLAFALPASRPSTRLSYFRLLHSLYALTGEFAALRRASIIQGCLFGGFSVFWSTLALMLQEPPYHLGSAAAGLFGILGLGGVAGAPFVGRFADRSGPRAVVGLGIGTVLLSFVVFGLWRSLTGLVIGVILLDLGVQMTNISNQSIIFGLSDAARSRVNTVFVTGIFLGGAFGSAAASIAWHQAGWGAVCGLGVALSIIAFVTHALPGRSAARA